MILISFTLSFFPFCDHPSVLANDQLASGDRKRSIDEQTTRLVPVEERITITPLLINARLDPLNTAW